jgi:hypothetical protein
MEEVMAMPIQAAPVDRANRAITMQAVRAAGITPAQINVVEILPAVCALCKVFPKIPFCPILCPT